MIEILKSYKNLDLIKITEDRYCVRKRYKGFLGKPKVEYFLLHRNGTRLLYEHLQVGETIGRLEDCEFIFNANVIAMGGI